MLNTLQESGSELLSYLNNLSGDQFSFRQAFEHLAQAVGFTEGVVITTLPRGTLQITQPINVSESLSKPYARQYHAEDRPTWHVIATGTVARLQECWPDGNAGQSPFVADYLRGNGFEYAAIVPLRAPVLRGYPGALHLYRTGEQGDFTDEEIRQLDEIRVELDSAICKVRQARKAVQSARSAAGTHPRVKQFALDGEGRPLVGDTLESLDDRLRQQIVAHARRRAQTLDDAGDPSIVDRLLLPDSRGVLWIFRAITHRHYPALGDGPCVIFSLQPECEDWSCLRPSDFQADAEIARLIPALRFMQDEFHRGPSLNEISRTVHLSPFHFHRRFTELLGITPKHFLLECQITSAKRQLLARVKELAKIAHDCGFAHQSHFTSRFKQVIGLTPTRWRRLALELQNGASD